MDEDAIFDAAMSRTTTAKHSRERDRDRDRSRGRDRDRGRDERKRSRTSHSDDDKPVWKPSGPLEDQAAMFQSAPPSSYGHGRGGGGGGGRGNGGNRGGGGRRGDGPVPEVFSVHHGEVRSIQSYGVFVNMPGFKDGLVHISQLASYRVEDANEVVSQGQRVWVKVVEVDSNSKVSLSMKMVNQETGRDEDPDHFEALEAQGRKGGGGQRAPMKFSEETHLGSVNMGLEKQMDGASYDLVKSDDEDEYQMEADLEAMWAAREAGADDVDGAGGSGVVDEPAGSGGPMGAQMAALLANEQENAAKAKRTKKHKKEKKSRSAKKKKKHKKHKKSSRHSSSSSS